MAGAHSDDLQLRQHQVREECHGSEGRGQPEVAHDEELRELAAMLYSTSVSSAMAARGAEATATAAVTTGAPRSCAGAAAPEGVCGLGRKAAISAQRAASAHDPAASSVASKADLARGAAIGQEGGWQALGAPAARLR
eukprot:CAMPEP_0179170766 /NCGR_PEP_ID=MMETSP0796-20121207/84146_1 /TAXON_ID=73915 /ORGANISM="Pyrodinium bahamense, Strain pbaha01" /LENGTH=137 /DNA_ID=CAMNT_0020873781 /DNA_START=89 /DNA_END=503 /DNA_ORIENTATION=-